MIYAEGNNREAIKLRLAEVPIILEANVQTYGRYYLPELPEIDNGKIVSLGIAISSSLPGEQDLATVSFANRNTFYEGNIGANANIVFCKYLTLTLVNKNKDIVLDQFPVVQLLSGPWSVGNRKFKTIPVETEILSKHSYFTLLLNSLSGPKSLLYKVNLLIYYRD